MKANFGRYFFFFHTCDEVVLQIVIFLPFLTVFIVLLYTVHSSKIKDSMFIDKAENYVKAQADLENYIIKTFFKAILQT